MNKAQQPSAGTSAVLRELENEIIDQINAKGSNEDIHLVLNTANKILAECEAEKIEVLNACRNSRHCRPLQPQLRGLLTDMCSPSDLQEMSTRAAEQFVCIFGVMLMCIVLYMALCVMEKAFSVALGTNKQKNLYNVGGKNKPS